MRDYFCGRCYYWLVAVDEAITGGYIRVICRSCRQRQRIDLSKPSSINSEQARSLRSSNLRTHAA